MHQIGRLRGTSRGPKEGYSLFIYLIWFITYLEKGYSSDKIEEAFPRYKQKYASATTVWHDESWDTLIEPLISGELSLKNWNILQSDPILFTCLPDRPNVAFRKPHVLRIMCLTSMWEYVVPYKGSWDLIDQLIQLGNVLIAWFQFVIYGLLRQCGLFYMGRTSRCLRTRFGESKHNILKARGKHSLPWHFQENHGKNPLGLSLFSVEAITGHPDLGGRHQKLCSRETFWIYRLGSFSPSGLNEDLEVHSVVWLGPGTPQKFFISWGIRFQVS